MKIPLSGMDLGNPAILALQAVGSYWGVTSADGSALGITVVDDGLVLEPSYDGLTIKILSGPAAGQARSIFVHNGNIVTVAAAFTNPAGAVQQITRGTLFCITSFTGGGSGPGPAPQEGLVYYGVVDAIPGANQFTIGSLAGLGAGKFVSPTNSYYAFVLRDAGGLSAAPQGEFQAITAYATATGIFTTAAFTAAVGVGDEILILHPSIAASIAIILNLAVPGADVATNVYERDVIGNKADTALYAITATASLMRYIKALVNSGIAASGAVNDAGAAITDFDTNLTEATNDHYNGMVMMFISGANAGQSHIIDDYIGASKNVSFATGDQWTDVPVTGDVFVILPTTDKLILSRLSISRAGAPQTFTKNITSAANAGDVNIATVTAQTCLIKRIIVRANAAQTGDLTKIGVYGGTGKVVTFIDDVTGVRANIAATDQQVYSSDPISLPATKTIVITLTGTGGTAVNLQIDIEYEAVADGGYLV